MKYFKLGKYNVSKYCLGTWSLGSNKKKNISYGAISDTKSKKKFLSTHTTEELIFSIQQMFMVTQKKKLEITFKKKGIRFFATKVGCISFKEKLNFSKKLFNLK